MVVPADLIGVSDEGSATSVGSGTHALGVPYPDSPVTGRSVEHALSIQPATTPSNYVHTCGVTTEGVLTPSGKC